MLLVLGSIFRCRHDTSAISASSICRRHRLETLSIRLQPLRSSTTILARRSRRNVALRLTQRATSRRASLVHPSVCLSVRSSSIDDNVPIVIEPDDKTPQREVSGLTYHSRPALMRRRYGRRVLGGCRAKDERRDANVEKSISITTGPRSGVVVVVGTVPCATSREPRRRHSNYVMRRDDDAAQVAASRDNDISTRGGRRHLFQLSCCNAMRYILIQGGPKHPVCF